uniref:Uncharacterized protein n=1 Tax=Leersia perrieri TaxID=77586 RepID=A0A0D9XIQ9_9ORYZ
MDPTDLGGGTVGQQGGDRLRQRNFPCSRIPLISLTVGKAMKHGRDLSYSLLNTGDKLSVVNFSCGLGGCSGLRPKEERGGAVLGSEPTRSALNVLQSSCSSPTFLHVLQVDSGACEPFRLQKCNCQFPRILCPQPK